MSKEEGIHFIVNAKGYGKRTNEKLQEYEKLKEDNRKLNNRINSLIKIKEKKEHNWNELKKYIGSEWYCFDNESVEYDVAKDILDKMQELEEGGNNG